MGLQHQAGVAFERSRAGRILVSTVMLVILGSLILWNLPAGRPRAEVRDLVAPVLLPLGLDQNWAVFAPNPRDFSVSFAARVTYADGSTKIWRPPETGLWFTPLSTYRWQKYNERVRADAYSGLWADAARYIASDSGPGVVKVELLRGFQPVVIPGSGEQAPPLQIHEFYEWARP